MELNRCPNCSGKLEMAPSRTKMICPYCDSEFSLGDATDSVDKSELINKNWFIYEWDYDNLIKNPKCAVALSSFIRCMNEYDTPDQVEEYQHTYLIPNCDDVSAFGIREEKMSEIKQRIAIAPGEHIVLYYDDGLFIHGKTGFVLTNKRALFVQKKEIKEVVFSTIPYIFVGYSLSLPDFKLGDKYIYNVPTMGSNCELQGACVAYICHCCFKDDPNRPQIRLIK